MIYRIRFHFWYFLNMAKWISRIINAAKWPLALCSPVLLPFAIAQWFGSGLLAGLLVDGRWILVGGATYLVLWQLAFKRRLTGSWFSTLEHEITHAVFAWLTLHRVHGIRTSWNDGGWMRYSGPGNWLITISPYFFPTLLLVPVVLDLFIFDQVVLFMVGAISAYHLTSTIRETHLAQTDLKRTGYRFAVLFLPTANVMVHGTALLYFTKGSDAAIEYVNRSWSNMLAWLAGLIS